MAILNGIRKIFLIIKGYIMIKKNRCCTFKLNSGNYLIIISYCDSLNRNSHSHFQKRMKEESTELFEIKTLYE
jgi:hypothetical protein